MRVSVANSLKPGSTPLLVSLIQRPTDAARMEVQNERNRRVALASIVCSLLWPTLDQYHTYFCQTSSLPCLQVARIFSNIEKDSLTFELIRLLFKPSKTTHRLWRLLSMMSIGPYSKKSQSELLCSYGIDLTLLA